MVATAPADSRVAEGVVRHVVEPGGVPLHQVDQARLLAWAHHDLEEREAVREPPARRVDAPLHHRLDHQNMFVLRAAVRHHDNVPVSGRAPACVHSHVSDPVDEVVHGRFGVDRCHHVRHRGYRAEDGAVVPLDGSPGVGVEVPAAAGRGRDLIDLSVAVTSTS